MGYKIKGKHLMVFTFYSYLLLISEALYILAMQFCCHHSEKAFD